MLTWFADWVSQTYLEDEVKYDKRRGAVLAAYGGLEVPLEGMFWFPFLEKVVGHSNQLGSVIKKTMLDQFLFTPCEVFVFMKWTNSLESREETFSEKLKRDFSITLLGIYTMWIPLSFATFMLVPLRFRAVFGCFCDLFSDTFMAFAAHNDLQTKLKKYFS